MSKTPLIPLGNNEKELSNKDLIGDRERLEKKEFERKNQAQKDKNSFSFSWIAIVVRGIVGTFISVFVYTQALRIEDEDFMSQFLLIANNNTSATQLRVNELKNTLLEMSTLYSLNPNMSPQVFHELTERQVKRFSYVKSIDPLLIDEVNSIQNSELKKKVSTALSNNEMALSYSPPPIPELAPNGTILTLITPITSSEDKTPLGILLTDINLKELFISSLDSNNRYATDIFVYSESEENSNQLLYFFNAEKEYDKVPPENPSKLILSDFQKKNTISIGNQKLTIIYDATPGFVEHTWQAIIASSIGVVITTFIVVTAWILLEIEKRQFSNVLHEDHIHEIEGTVDLLESTKNRLVAQENLASLGGLTAGIAHEIKNPLNFINNFSTLSIELINEIDKYVNKYQQNENNEEHENVIESIDTLKENIQTIHEQGQRADSTIQRMLAHSRGKPGEWMQTDMHKLLDEYITFSFHGMRAKNSQFNVKIEKKFHSQIKDIKVITNDLSRVFLNLMNNSFQAIEDKSKQFGPEYTNPTVTITTENVGKFFRVRIRDNGAGISEENKAKIFTPFFTTKPTGVGTGLGLSLSYNIIVREHGGSLTFDSKEGEYTEFIITIPLVPKQSKEEISQ